MYVDTFVHIVACFTSLMPQQAPPGYHYRRLVMISHAFPKYISICYPILMQ